jgi:N-acyl-D-amino-acid deacylase
MKSMLAAGVGMLLAVLACWVRGDEPAARTHREAVEAGLRIVQKALKNYPEHRNCFSCHHQTLPMQAMASCREAGYEVDEPLFEEATKFSLKGFSGRLNSLREGKNIGGRALTVGYGLWTLDVAGHAHDQTSEAMVAYLLKTQEDDGSWKPSSSRRPPMGDSTPMCTTLSAYYARQFAADSQREEVDKAIDRARGYLVQAAAESQEDRDARLWGLSLLEADEAEIDKARQAVLAAQREDGGWAQLDEMQSDAYATGQALFVLRQSGLPVSDQAYRRGVKYLLDTQQADGSWLVETRAKPVQVFFDNGDPGGKSQFITIAATGWAVAALAGAEP